MSNNQRPEGLEDVERAELAEVIAVWRDHRNAHTSKEERDAKHEIIALLYDFAVEYHEHLVAEGGDES